MQECKEQRKKKNEINVGEKTRIFFRRKRIKEAKAKPQIVLFTQDEINSR